jgi:hypothetical protein
LCFRAPLQPLVLNENDLKSFINAATINGAYAMGLSASRQYHNKGKSYFDYSNSSYYQLPYAFGSNLIDTVFIAGNNKRNIYHVLFYYFTQITFYLKVKLVFETN